MFDFTDEANIGKEYKNFVLLSIDNLPDYKAKAVYLRHKTTGLEVYHILKNDKENLFAFAFRTIAKDSMGTAHIMEHSTLCGSEKYPLKEPFTTLAGQSLNTFLNAMTYPDKTVYPGASLVRSDYFNMMDVYADAVFFPKLDYLTFLQEGHRLEIDDDGNVSIQGVVYNEMKGNYTSFFQMAYSSLVSSMYPNSYPSFDSGGDPIEIPSLTYEKFLDFHQKFYAPDNCLLFLYGDIPTCEQLDYFDKNFISRLEKKFNYNITIANFDSKTPIVKDSVKELLKLNFQKKSTEIKEYSCDANATGSLVCTNWYSGEYNCEKSYLQEILCGNDGSPVSKAFKESGLGDDLVVGNFGQFDTEFYSLGLSGVKKGDEKKVFALIEDTVKNLYETGVTQRDIDGALMGIDFELREDKRFYGPFSIRIMEYVLKSWTVGKPCSLRLNQITEFENLKKKIKEDKDFTKKLIKKYFLSDKITVRYICEPSSLFFKEREKLEKDITEKLKAKTDLEKLKIQLEELHKEQQRKETPEELACIPHTKISELERKIDFPDPTVEYLKTKDGQNIPLFVNDINSNGIFYFDVMFPFDCLEPKDLEYVVFLSEVLTNLGWNNKKWNECIAESVCIMGDAYGGILSNTTVYAKETEELINKYKDDNFIDRIWISLSFKALSSYAEQTLDLFSQIITTMDFKDTKRLETLIRELYSDTKAAVITNGKNYAQNWAKSFCSKAHALKEIACGFSQIETVKKYKKMNKKKLLRKFEDIYNTCRQNGAVVHIGADTQSLQTIKPLLQDFVIKADLKKLQPPKKITLESLKPYIYKNKKCEDDFRQTDLKCDTQTGYAVLVSKSATYFSKEISAEQVLSYYLNSHDLWDKLRTTGGSYGASCNVDGLTQTSCISTYRDPNPEKSIQVILNILKDIQNSNFTQDDIEKTIVSIYGDNICPKCPKDQSSFSFERMLYGFNQQQMNIKLENLLSVTVEDIKNAAKRMAEYIEQRCIKVIFCNKKARTSGKRMKLPL